jgi:hypothetical protein
MCPASGRSNAHGGKCQRILGPKQKIPPRKGRPPGRQDDDELRVGRSARTAATSRPGETSARPRWARLRRTCRACSRAVTCCAAKASESRRSCPASTPRPARTGRRPPSRDERPWVVSDVARAVLEGRRVVVESQWTVAERAHELQPAIGARNDTPAIPIGANRSGTALRSQ